MQNSNLNIVEMFGFLSGFVTVVFIGYRRHLKTGLPIIAIGLACCAAYAFMAGVWSAAFVLVAVTASEVRQWYARRYSITLHVTGQPVASGRLVSEGRIERMFGQA